MTKTMTGVEICEAFSHAMDKGDTATLEKLMMPDFVWHHLAPYPGRDSDASFILNAGPMFEKNYHYFEHKIIQIHGMGDYVVMHTVGTGKRKSQPEDAPEDRTPALKIIRLENGRVAEIWALPDLVTFLKSQGELNLSPEGMRLVGFR